MKRRYLLFGMVSLFSGIAGCSARLFDSPMLDLTLYNHTDNPYTVEMKIFRDDSTRNEARVFSSRLDVEPDGQTEQENVAEAEPLVISYSVYEDNSKLTDQDHVHYYPGDSKDDDSQVFDIHSPGILTRRGLG
jgi:hypothetical protein